MKILDLLSQETVVDKTDVFYMIPCAALYAVYRLLVSNFVLKPISKHIKPKNQYKFIHRGFDCIHYVMCTIIGVFAFLKRPYGHCSYYYFDCRQYLDNAPAETVITYFEKVYYYLFAAYYFSDIFWIRTTKDIPILIVHHSITIGWILSFALIPLPPVCLTGGLLHDYVDFFLYSGKVATYFDYQKLANVLLILFAISFFWLRILNCGSIYYTGSISDTPQRHTLYFRTLFSFLYMCHLIWGYQIVMALKRIFTGDKIHDTRSDRAESKQHKE